MVTATERDEYLDEIRQQVCSRCVERPPGGPPCAPLGKDCGVELHLPQLIESIHQVHSSRIGPYLDHNRQEICEHCAFLHSSICPCPMDYLAVLVVQAVETVDERRRQRGEEILPARRGREVELTEIHRAFVEAAGAWTGCDWPTFCGKSGLNLQGWTAAQARAMAQETTDPQAVEDWYLASHWLTQIEHNARQAQIKGAAAVQAAEAGKWREALANAEWAWALEFATGRPLRRSWPLAWQRLREVIEAAMFAHQDAETSVSGGGTLS